MGKGLPFLAIIIIVLAILDTMDLRCQYPRCSESRSHSSPTGFLVANVYGIKDGTIDGAVSTVLQTSLTELLRKDANRQLLGKQKIGNNGGEAEGNDGWPDVSDDGSVALIGRKEGTKVLTRTTLGYAYATHECEFFDSNLSIDWERFSGVSIMPSEIKEIFDGLRNIFLA